MDGHLTTEGIWEEILLRPDHAAPRPALFLDRDGVIVEDVHHLHRPEDIRMIAGAAATIAAANARGYPVVITTNQSGVGRGYFDWPDFLAVQTEILARLAAAGARVNAVFACPHHALANPPYRYDDSPWRKPSPGMLLQAARLLPIDLGCSWIVGDRAADLEAGRAAGLAGGLLVGEKEGLEVAAPRDERFDGRRGHSVADAVRLPLFRDGAG